jgi:hypothetical protein
MSSLKAQAEALGIKVHGNWSDDTLRAKIAEAKTGQGLDIQPGNNVEPSALAASGAAVADDGTELKTEPTPKAKKSGVVLDEKTMLWAKAQELNIEVDEDWGEDRLRAEIQTAREGRADLQVKGAVPPAEYADPNFDAATKADKTGIPVILERDYWDSEDHRLKAGTEITVSKAVAADLISKGVARRNDPL